MNKFNIILLFSVLFAFTNISMGMEEDYGIAAMHNQYQSKDNEESEKLSNENEDEENKNKLSTKNDTRPQLNGEKVKKKRFKSNLEIFNKSCGELANPKIEKEYKERSVIIDNEQASQLSPDFERELKRLTQQRKGNSNKIKVEESKENETQSEQLSSVANTQVTVTPVIPMSQDSQIQDEEQNEKQKEEQGTSVKISNNANTHKSKSETSVNAAVNNSGIEGTYDDKGAPQIGDNSDLGQSRSSLPHNEIQEDVAALHPIGDNSNEKDKQGINLPNSENEENKTEAVTWVNQPHVSSNDEGSDDEKSQFESDQNETKSESSDDEEETEGDEGQFESDQNETKSESSDDEEETEGDEGQSESDQDENESESSEDEEGNNQGKSNSDVKDDVKDSTLAKQINEENKQKEEPKLEEPKSKKTSDDEKISIEKKVENSIDLTTLHFNGIRAIVNENGEATCEAFERDENGKLIQDYILQNSKNEPVAVVKKIDGKAYELRNDVEGDIDSLTLADYTGKLLINTNIPSSSHTNNVKNAMFSSNKGIVGALGLVSLCSLIYLKFFSKVDDKRDINIPNDDI